LPKAVRAELHERFAGWLEEHGENLAEVDEIVGYHLEQAAKYRHELGLSDSALEVRAGERLGVAGRHALWRADSGAARGLLGRALALLRPLRLDVYLELNLADIQPTEQEAAAIAEAAAERAHAAHDRCAEAVARAEAARRRVALGTGATVDEQEALAREAISLLQEAGDHEGLVHAWMILGGAHNHRGRYEDYTLACEQVLYHARQIGQPGLFRLPAALVLGPRPADEALRMLDHLLVDEPNPWARLPRAELLAMLGRFEEAWATAHEASRLLLELTGDEGDEQLAHIAALAGDLETAARYMRMACDLFQARKQFAVLSTYAPRLGRYLSILGRYEEAEPLAQLGRDLGDECDVATQTAWRQVQALLCSHRGHHEEAERLAREAVAIIERTDALNVQGDALCDLAEVLEQADRLQEARTILEQAQEQYERKKNLAMIAQIRQRLGLKVDITRLV
jgi:tetratricopeptide (TPR) repeat protein